MKTFMFLSFCVFGLFYIHFTIFTIKSFVIEKIKNILIYEDHTFTNREVVILHDWDSLLYGRFIKRFPLLFSFIKWQNLGMLFCAPVMIGLAGIAIFGDVPAKATTTGFHNLYILGKILLICYIFLIIVVTLHVILLKKYKIEADQQKSLEETRQIIRKPNKVN